MPVTIFFCYAHKDEALLKKLMAHLTPLLRKNLIGIWYDCDISAGSEWEQEISHHLNAAQIILLLVSPDFIASDYCYGIEMRRALERHQRGEVRVIPIILRPVLWEIAPFSKLQVLPKNAKPVKSWSDVDKALLDVTRGIRKVLEQLDSKPFPRPEVIPSQASKVENERMDTVKTLDVVHRELLELSQKTLSDGRPAYLFRGERINYFTTLSSADRLYHNPKLDLEIVYELDEITAFAMSQSYKFLSRQLPPKLAGAFAQHYGLPTQIFDFTASPNVAISFAANRPWHKSKATIGTIGILDVQLAEQNGKGVFVDLRGFPEAKRARRQEAFGMIYRAFDPKDFVDLKRTDIVKKIGLTWQLFGHLPGDEAYLHLVRADEDLVSIQDDKFASIPEEIVDQFVLTHGLLSDKAAKILAENVPAVMRSPQENFNQWSKGRKD